MNTELDFYWSGYGNSENDGIFIGPVPGRKKIALFETINGKSEVLAHFKSVNHARRALRWFDTIYGSYK